MNTERVLKERAKAFTMGGISKKYKKSIGRIITIPKVYYDVSEVSRDSYFQLILNRENNDLILRPILSKEEKEDISYDKPQY